MEEDGAFYLFDSQGERKVLYSQTQNGRIEVKDQVYLLNPDGSLKKGFFQENGETYYANGEKGLSRGWKDQTKNYVSEAKKLPTLPPPLKAGPSTGTGQT